MTTWMQARLIKPSRYASAMAQAASSTGKSGQVTRESRSARLELAVPCAQNAQAREHFVPHIK
jgi:hypothetical protein